MGARFFTALENAEVRQGRLGGVPGQSAKDSNEWGKPWSPSINGYIWVDC